MVLGWPASLTDGEVTLRPLRRGDEREWLDVRARNAAWLLPWEASSPHAENEPPLSFGRYVRSLSKQAREGVTLPFVIEINGGIAGQVTVGQIAHGSIGSGAIGYWVAREHAGKGVAPTAVALAADHCFWVLGLHRVEINIRPENAASLRVVAKLGLRDEGLRERFLHIQGRWCDHRSFAVTREEVPEGLLARWHRLRQAAAD